MKIIDCKQRSAEWFSARLGKPSASMFHAFVTPTGKPALNAARRRYILELVAERLTRLPSDHYATGAMERGDMLEGPARKWYAMATGQKVREVGFVLSDDGRYGASPDGLCEERGLEIKCPLVPGFMEVCETGVLPDAHMLQCQAGLWLTGYAAWDYVLYTDVRGLQPQIITVTPDKVLHAAFAEIVPNFCDALDALEAKLREQGHGYTAPEDDLPTWEELITGRTIV